MHKATAAHVPLLLAGMALVDGAQAVVIQVPGERAGHWDTSLMINWGHRKHYAYPIFSQHTLDLRRWHPSPPIPSHFAVNSPQIHQFSAF